ncbi:MAG: DsrE family protein [Desulfobacteraceae bacterium]|nr:DsrE family protein [Desulfobacteraceae bacterium]
MTKKVALFVFRDDPMCFVHVLLNTLDMHERGHDVRMIMEGEATKLLPGLEKESTAVPKMWKQVKEKNLVAGVCKACSTQMGTAFSAEKQGLPLLDDMSGHPSFAGFIAQGCEILVF